MGNVEFENAISTAIKNAMEKAINEALLYRGQTDPNPTVGAAAIHVNGEILGVAAHEKAGGAHAEAKLLARLESEGRLQDVHTLLVTLEPCHHFGRQPPCTQAILKSGVKRVIVGALDPNPKAQGGMGFLNANGVSTQVADSHEIQKRCEKIIRPFSKSVLEKKPFITVKVAKTNEGSMIPPSGLKTFTDRDALKYAHELRKRSRGILTGSGTVLSDLPLFTVRNIPDFAPLPRFIAVLDRRGRTPQDWIESREKAGFQVKIFGEIEKALEWFYTQGCLEVLVEAGPTLTDSILKTGLWDECVTITQSAPDSGQKDQIRCIENDKCSQESSKN